MEPLSPPTTMYHGPTRRRQSRSATRSRSSQSSRQNTPTPQVSVPAHREGHDLPPAVDEAYYAASSSATTSTTALEKRRPGQSGFMDIPGGSSTIENTLPFKKRRIFSDADQQAKSYPAGRVHVVDDEGSAGPSQLRLNTAISRNNSDVMDVDEDLSPIVPSSRSPPSLEHGVAAPPPSSPIDLCSPVLQPSCTIAPAGHKPFEPLASYNCPICFSPPTYATLTPCGHICCGDCLFSAVKSTIERAAFHGPAAERAK
jgi:hypothetical protein